jgi:hypothetical protein
MKLPNGKDASNIYYKNELFELEIDPLYNSRIVTYSSLITGCSIN